MKAVMKDGSTVEIDTSCLFNNQYNTTDNRRIFDAQIARIIDDVRDGLGKCKYCGAIVRRGEEEQHFAAEEAKPCEKCFWYIDKLIQSDKSEPVVVKIQNEDGTVTVRKTFTSTDTYEKYCSHKERYNGLCKNAEHRMRGIEWFTPGNTFFLAHPNGFDYIPLPDNMEDLGFDLRKELLDAKYKKKIGSYTLTAIIRYVDGKAVGIKHFRLQNCKKQFTFRIDDDKFYFYDYDFGWSRHCWRAEGVPSAVLAKVKAICQQIKEAA